LQLAVNEKSKIKNLGGATPDIVIPQNFCDKFNAAMYAKDEWLSGCADKCSITYSDLSYSNPSPKTTIIIPTNPHCTRVCHCASVLSQKNSLPFFIFDIFRIQLIHCFLSRFHKLPVSGFPSKIL
jgi:hypothetical protein